MIKARKIEAAQVASPDVFWGRSEPEPNTGCWLWTGATQRDGYGMFRGHRSHRVAYALAHGDVPTNMLVCHRCDNPPCVNPDHLFLGSNDDNMRDAARKGRVGKFAAVTERQRKTAKRGMARHGSKLTDNQVREIRIRCANGEMQTFVAPDYGVSAFMVSMIVRRRKWTHI